MPDNIRYSSVSVTKKARTDLTRLQSELKEEHGVDFSIAKIIEKLALTEARKYYDKKV